ncbi:SGNH/GDSL hydrolase family protein [Streptomyces diastatochromogenes]|uniref:SGNH hydrolase n=1 Tax=Streptomyces diastatochromogenes TaxID=42236 RepID=A0A233SCX7_STRDA|nr:SGNH/GDSL hydrolase family protein [Streptomyces diastatochromogenes]MCZ0990747.1 SGNH/GDSL hydrolase family protein [Streptomyces diastatochromogenes]OXY93518.1 SGNH hydrolase [Streptomyces diastatochromogenes]
MKPPSRAPLATLLTTCVLVLTLVVTSSALRALLDRTNSARPMATSATGRHWVNTWTGMPQLTEPANLPPAPFTGDKSVLTDTTLRQTVRVTTGGHRIRLRLSNAYGDTPLPLTAVTVALPSGGQAGVSAIEPDSLRRVTFAGRDAATVPVGAQLVSDPLDFDLRAGSDLTVTAYTAQGQPSLALTSHPGSRTTSYLLHGDHTRDDDLPDATPVNHWYLLSDVEVLAPGGIEAVAVVGDSLTDGRGSTTNGNDRWPDQFFDRLRNRAATSDIAVLNQAAGGNRVLNDGLGPNVLARLDRDVLSRSGVSWLILFEGVNDIGTAAATPEAQRAVTDDLIAGYRQIVVRAHAQGIRVYGATLTPFGGNTPYDDPAGEREASRQRVNTWIRTPGHFDAVIDFDRAVRDPAQPSRLLPDLQVGDGLHLNPKGYGVLAGAVPERLFRR